MDNIKINVIDTVPLILPLFYLFEDSARNGATGMKKTNLFTALVTAAMLGLIAIMVVDLLPLLKQVAANAGDESKIVEYISSYGFKGVPILIGLQALQVITAVIPSAAIQVLTGLCYGVWWGTLINLVGCVLGNLIIFVAMVCR